MRSGPSGGYWTMDGRTDGWMRVQSGSIRTSGVGPCGSMSHNKFVTLPITASTIKYTRLSRFSLFSWDVPWMCLAWLKNPIPCSLQSTHSHTYSSQCKCFYLEEHEPHIRSSYVTLFALFTNSLQIFLLKTWHNVFAHTIDLQQFTKLWNIFTLPLQIWLVGSVGREFDPRMGRSWSSSSYRSITGTSFKYIWVVRWPKWIW